jgi:hypothetical protein
MERTCAFAAERHCAHWSVTNGVPLPDFDASATAKLSAADRIRASPDSRIA